MVSAAQKARLDLAGDFPYYAESCLKIRPKEGQVVPFRLNKAQRYIHERLEAQKAEKGWVRAIILKGRQQGCSTYVEGRFMHRTTHEFGYQAMILTHEEDATNNLFKMAKRYYEHLPKWVKPETSHSNEKKLTFKNLDSGYALGTAGNKSVGRSATNQLFHGSEVAFWPNASEHAKGVLQTVPLSEGTEVIFESTANGLGNYFHQQWKAAESGNSDFIAIFVPWYWQDEYRRDDEITLTEKEIALKDSYGLEDSQFAWRRAKIRELSTDGRDGEKAFRQEYPMNAAEAFQVSGSDGLITAERVESARRRDAQPGAVFRVGVDPSRGGDRFAIMRRAGRKAWGYQKYVKDEVATTGQQVAICKRILDTVDPVVGRKPDVMYIDAGGGDAIVDILRDSHGYKNVIAISFGSSTLYPEKYNNKRSEMWGQMSDWLADENLPPEVPDDDEVQADLCASPYRRDAHDRICMIPKEKIIKDYGFSPDSGDALCLTFCGVNPPSSSKLAFKSQW